MSQPSPPITERQIPQKQRFFNIYTLLSLPLLAFLVLPLLALILRISFRDMLASLSEPVITQAISLSLTTSVAATLLTIIFGTPLAYALSHHYMPFERFVDTLIDLPTVLPPAVAGVALLMAFGRRGLLGSTLEAANIHIAFTQVAVILAQTFVAAPFYIKAARIGFANVNVELEQSSALDGAHSGQVLRYVVLPLSRTALLGGAVMTWARALGEFGATIIFAGNFPGRTQTMPLAIYLGFQFNLETALTLSVILLGFSFLVLMLVKGLLQREIT
jgi:molybdate transport system permease protein